MLINVCASLIKKFCAYHIKYLFRAATEGFCHSNHILLSAVGAEAADQHFRGVLSRGLH